MGAIEQKKDAKRNGLLEAAAELFLSKGVSDTAISDIAKSAGVAKGTFYLYFKDKYDLLEKVAVSKSSYVIKNAFAALEIYMRQQPDLPFEEAIIFFMDYILSFLEKNKSLLRLIHKNLSLGLFKNGEENEITVASQQFIENYIRCKGAPETEAQQTFYIILNMLSGVCSDAILRGEPYTLEEIKPALYDMVRKVLA